MSNFTALPPPDKLGGFEIIRRLGSGGMAELFVAKKRGAEDTYKVLVLKRVLPAQARSRRFRTMFIEEAQLASRLNHPNVVQVYEFTDYGDEGLLLSMEYVEGTDLGKLYSAARTAGTRIPPWVAAYIVAEAAKGLHYAHERKESGSPLEIVHRDVSPQNILVSFEGAVKIADFGIATANLFREQPGVLKGKFGYMSPEQARGEKVDRRSDIYSLGVVLHQLLTGRYLHGTLGGDALLEAVRSGVVEPPSTFARDVPAELEAIVMRALARDPAERFPTARELSAAITRALFQRQEIVDASTLETLVGRLVGRELTSPGIDAPSEVGSLVPSVSMAPSVVAPRVGVDSEPPSARTPGSEPPPSRSRRGQKLRRSREVRHVALLLLRLSGLAEIEERFGRAALAGAIERVRGTLDNIAYKRGARWTWDASGSARAVVGLLSSPGRAAADAAWLAVDTHEALAGLAEDLPAPLRAAIGIARGVATGERDELGHLVHHTLREPTTTIATLLVAQAPIGRTWVAGGLYRLVRRDFRWGDAPAITLPEGSETELPRAMRVYALERALTREERLAEMAGASGDLVGRKAERADLDAAFHEAVAGEGRVVCRVVAGELGIGKTALVASFANDLPPDARVVRIECTPARASLPFGVVQELLREATGATADDSPSVARSKVEAALDPTDDDGRAIARTLAEIVTGRGEGDEGEVALRSHAVRAGVRRLLARLAALGPLVIVVDNLQWCDRAGLELVTALVQRRDAQPILAIFATRPDARVSPFLEKLVRIDLDGLTPAEQVELVQTRFGVEEGAADVCADLAAKLSDNPLFLLETIDALLERGALEIRDADGAHPRLVRAENVGEQGLALPQTIEQLVDDRLRELPASERRVADWLAIAGGPLAVADVVALGELADESAVDDLVGRRICERRGDSIDFRHPLVRDVAYLAIEPEARSRMHARLGARLAGTPLARGLSAAIVARHLARGDEPTRAAELYLEAAAAARATYQLPLAVRYYQRALALLDEADERALVAHEALETLFRMLGRRAERRRHLEKLRRLARASRRPRWVSLALARSARLELDEGRPERGVASAETAESIAHAARIPAVEVEAQATLGELLRELGEMQGALDACDRALATAASPRVPSRVRAEALRARGVLLRRVGRVRDAVDCYAEAIAVFRSVGARRLEARAKNALAFAMFVLERFEDAIALGLESIAIDLAIGGRFQIAKTLTNIGQSYARLGDVPRGIAYLKRAREAHERYGDQDSRADTLLVSACLAIEAGDLAGARAFVGDASALGAVTSNAYDRVHERIVRARLARALGDHDVAVGLAHEARLAAEDLTLVSFHLIASALEAASRVAIGEPNAGVLLATSTLEALASVQGTEYGLEIRALAAEALSRAGAPAAAEARASVAAHARHVEQTIRDERLRASFGALPIFVEYCGATRQTTPP